MEFTNEKLLLQLNDKKTGKNIYQHEINLVSFQKEILANEEISLFYTFKDASVEFDEQISSKFNLKTGGGEICFTIKYLDSILYSCIFNAVGINESNISQYEMQLYFILESVSKIITNKIAEEHKKWVLSNNI